MSIKDQIKVMQAFIAGKTIECSQVGANDWIVSHAPTWNWAEYDYRISSERSYRPYANASEFCAAIKQHGPYMKWSNEKNSLNEYNLIITFNDIEVCIYDARVRTVKYEDLTSLFVWQDGTICGVIIEDEKK